MLKIDPATPKVPSTREGASMRWSRISSKISFLVLAACLTCFYGCAGLDSSAKVADAVCTDKNDAVLSYPKTIASAPPELAEAIRKFPKGADIHNHLSGTVMPEDYIVMGSADADCYGTDPQVPSMLTIKVPGKCTASDKLLSQADDNDKQAIVKSLSMYEFSYSDIQSGHDQFFNTFGRFGAVSGSDGNRGKMLAKLLQQANADQVSYAETMLSFQSSGVGKLADMLRMKYPDSSSFTNPQFYKEMYDYLVSSGLEGVAAAARNDVSGYVNNASVILKCSTTPDPACSVSYAFLSEINRNAAQSDGTVDLPKIFTQTALSFLLSSMEPRVVGVNLVSGEDLPVSMANFQTEMQFITFFHQKFPKVNIALHAGEITPCFVGTGNPALKDHITGSLDAGAKRIGHAISFGYLTPENQADIVTLLKSKNALVEILFTSNAQILGVTGPQHPFPLYYWKYGVPASFSTDDEGVSHAGYSDEWIYAYMQYNDQYGFGYNDMVKLARYSQQYSFVPGEPLWADVAQSKMAWQCAKSTPGTSVDIVEPCVAFLANSPKATMQWNYEKDLAKYYAEYGKVFEK